MYKSYEETNLWYFHSARHISPHFVLKSQPRILDPSSVIPDIRIGPAQFLYSSLIYQVELGLKKVLPNKV